MPTVQFSGPNNSTLFTTCCGVAICDDQSQCPICGEEITPYSHRERWETAMQTFYGPERLKKIEKDIIISEVRNDE